MPKLDKPVSWQPSAALRAYCLSFERSELRKHPDVGLVLLGQRRLYFRFNVGWSAWTCEMIPTSPGFSRGVADTRRSFLVVDADRVLFHLHPYNGSTFVLERATSCLLPRQEQGEQAGA